MPGVTGQRKPQRLLLFCRIFWNATKTFKETVLEAKDAGYTGVLLFFWLSNPELAKERVKTRVKEGGHGIAEDVIERRYRNGIINLFDIYLSKVDYVIILDNSEGRPVLVAKKSGKKEMNIFDGKRFNQLKNYYDKRK
ncbi:hypothetical protein [Limibacterium fermenti]|uniref:hypothetical protein n=1 Tax=Limibacterium fermenti TaxID=3229863 RepID=UPI003A766784